MPSTDTKITRASGRRAPSLLLAAGLSLALTVAVLIPFFLYGSASGHDFEFHVASWLDAAYQWHEGTIYPRWTAWTNHGFGEPRFIFYPPLSWILGAALTQIVPGNWAPILFILITQTFAGASAFVLLRRLTTERGAILGSACYAINANALLMIYIRSDFAEQLACAFFPLMALAALRLGGFLEGERPRAASVALFALPFAAVWLSNAPAGVIASYSMALLFAWSVVAQRSLWPGLRGVAGLALGLGLAGFYLAPAAYEQRWVNIAQVLATGLLPSQNFLFTEIDDPEHTWFNWLASGCAVVLMLLLAGSALASRRWSAAQPTSSKERGAWNGLLVLGAAASLLMTPVTAIFWRYLPKLRFVQFPWRWMSMVALIAACFLSVVLSKKRGWLLFLLYGLLTIPLAHVLTGNGWWDSDEMETQKAAVTNGEGFDGTDEYDPAGDDHLDLPLKAPRARLVADSGAKEISQATVRVEKWTTEEKLVHVEAPSASRLVLRVLNYPAWRVEVNSKIVTPQKMGGLDEMVIPVERGSWEIRVSFQRTKDRTVGGLISILSGLVAGGLLVFGRGRNRVEVG